MRSSSRLPIRFLHLDPIGFHLFNRARLNSKACTMLIDTGASRSVIDKSWLSEKFPALSLDVSDHQSTGLGTNTMKVELVTFKSVQLGSRKISTYQFAVLDLHHVNTAYMNLGHKPVQAVIGSDLLLLLQAKIDYAQKQLAIR
jgi:hypothetical protein